MKIKAWVKTYALGSMCTWQTEIDDEEVEGMTAEERDKYISELVEEELHNEVEWGWEVVE